MHKFVLLKQKNIMDIIIICKYNTEIYSAFRICDSITELSAHNSNSGGIYSIYGQQRL